MSRSARDITSTRISNTQREYLENIQSYSQKKKEKENISQKKRKGKTPSSEKRKKKEEIYKEEKREKIFHPEKGREKKTAPLRERKQKNSSRARTRTREGKGKETRGARCEARVTRGGMSIKNAHKSIKRTPERTTKKLLTSYQKTTRHKALRGLFLHIQIPHPEGSSGGAW